MKWKIIRNENKEIIKYELNNEIYIEREYLKGFTNDRYVNYLIINGKEIMSSLSGYTLKDMKNEASKHEK